MVRSADLEREAVIEDGKIVGWVAELRWQPGSEVSLPDGFELGFSAGHTVSGPYDRRTLTSPLVITVRSNDRRPVREHLQRLDAVHALLAVAHRETPSASTGGVRFTADQEGYCDFWERTMMTHDGTAEVTHQFPYLWVGTRRRYRGCREVGPPCP